MKILKNRFIIVTFLVRMSPVMHLNLPLKIGSKTLNLKTKAKKVEFLTFRLKTTEKLHKSNIVKIKSFIQNQARKSKTKLEASIVIPDKTRPLPSRELLERIVNIVALYRFKKINLIVAYGNHKKHSTKRLHLPKSILRKVSIIHHDSEDIKNLAKIHGHQTRSRKAFRKYITGKNPCKSFLSTKEFEKLRKEFILRSKKTFYVNKAFARSDLRIVLSEIKPHQIFGYSGGTKMILPGLFDKNSIIANHIMRMHPNSRLGNLRGNLPRMESHEIAENMNVSYITVISDRGRIYYAGTCSKPGDYKKTAAIAERLFKIKTGKFSTVISIGLAPVDINLYQLTKVITPAAYALKKGGKIIVASYIREKDCDLDTLNERIYGLTIKRELPSHKEKVYLYSNLPNRIVKKSFLIPLDKKTFYKMVEAEKESLLVISDGDLAVPS